MTDEAGAGERGRVLELVREHGWNATSFQTLEEGYRYFFHGNDACVAYVDTGSAWVAAGAPIAETAALDEVGSAFVRAATALGRRSCFFGTERRYVSLSSDTLRAIQIGEQPIYDPHVWSSTLGARRSLREQLRRARAKGVVVREATTRELLLAETRARLGGLVDGWLSTKPLAPMAFLVRVEPFTFPEHRRCFVAERDGRIVAFAGVVPVPARGGWFVEDLIRSHEAPNGTTELLLDGVLSWAARGGTEWLTLGLAPLSGAVPSLLRWIRRGSSLLYDFDGLHAYKAKLGPSDWLPIHLSFPKSQWAVSTFYDVLCAFSDDGLLRFGGRTASRWLRRLAAGPGPAWWSRERTSG